MGNDGGSIPDRRDLVRNKPKAEQADKANQTRAKWLFCALSKRKLQEPVVSCALGKLYNKDSIIEFLLDKSAYGDGERICGHIRSLKDVKTLTLTPNPAPLNAESTTERVQFVCPLTLKEMNGLQPFVYLSTCGCVFTSAGLKTLTQSATDQPTAIDDNEGLDVCPQCAKKFSRTEDVIQLNPAPEEEEKMRETMERKRLLEPTKKGKKRKANAATAAADVDAHNQATENGDAEPPSKRRITSRPASGTATPNSSTPRPSLNPSIAAASRAMVSGLALEEAKRKAGMSDVVKSLYVSDENKKRKETFMTMGTFTRYA